MTHRLDGGWIPRCATSLLALVTALACDAADGGEMVVVEPGWIVGDLLAERVATLEPDPYGLSMPRAIALHGDTVAVLDAGNDRVVLFDGDLEPLQTFGRSGAGPGELEGPIGLRWDGDAYVVFDPANQRISRFDASGGLDGETAVEAPAGVQDFGLDSRGAAFLPYPGLGHLLMRVGPSGISEPFGGRPDSAAIHSTGASLDQVAITAGDTVHLLDWRLRLHKISPSGEVVMVRSLPAPFIEHSQAQSRQLQRSIGTRSAVSAVPPNLTTTSDGDLLISASNGAGGIGLVVETESYEAAMIRAPAGHPLRFLRHAMLRDSSLFVLTMDGMRIYRISAQ